MGALVVDIATAFVLLVVGGCARVLGRQAWFWLGEIWRAHVYVYRKLAAAKPREKSFLEQVDQAREQGDARRMKELWARHCTGTKNAEKVPVYGDAFPIDGNEWYHKELEKARQELSEEEFARLEKRLEDAKGWRRRGEATTQRARLGEDDEARGLLASNYVRISKGKLEALEKVAHRARMVLEPYLYYGEAYATPQSLELLRRAVEELEEGE